MTNVDIITRDINGLKTQNHFIDWYEAYKFALDQLDKNSSDEILLIFINGSCVYSFFSTIEPVNWEDIVGFFA